MARRIMPRGDVEQGASVEFPTAEALASALRARELQDYAALPGRTNHLKAGVLLPLRWHPDRVDTVVTLRPDRMSRHGGEVSFVGGKPEPHDLDIEATALREAREELGIRGARVLGRLSSMPVYTSEYRLEPFVAQIDADAVFTPDPGEVAAVLELDLTGLIRAGRIEAVDIARDGQVWRMPIFRPGGHVLFGATAITLMELIGVLADVMGAPMPDLVPGDLDFEDILQRKAGAGR